MAENLPPPPEPEAAPPTRVGPFQIEGELGRGGMGVIYRGVGPSGERAAVKVVRAALSMPDVRRRFEREGSIRIDHPNVVKVLAAGSAPEGDSLYIALELLDGESLDQRLLRGPLPAREVVDIGVQACRGLAAAHGLGVIHRDLKPSNLFCCKDGTVKILDFGIALLLDNETRLTSVGGVIGTPAYMAPEQVRGDISLDARIDIWSLGTVLYEALSARSAFLRDTLLACMFAINMEEPEPLWSLAPRAPPALFAAIEKCIAKRPDLRWGSVTELSLALSGIDLGTPEALEPTSRPPPANADLGETTLALPALPSPPSNLIPLGEHRIVAILLAQGVSDLRRFGEAVRGRGGSVLPLLGQRAIGLFGAERWEGDEVARAAAAALDARRAAQRMAVASGRARSSGGGISGDVLRAAEQGSAVPLSGVAVDAVSARNLEGMFAIREVTSSVFEITARHAEDTSPSRHGDASAPLLGRDAEVAQLRAGLQRVNEESQPIVLLVSGPPGIGKSRLRRALELELAGLDGVTTVMTARAEPLRREAALSLIALGVRSCLSSQLSSAAPSSVSSVAELGGIEPAAAILRLSREAIDDEGAARDCARFLAELLGVPMPDTAAVLAARADPQLMADRLRLALLDLFEGLAQKGPIALVLEDLQWADRASLSFLDDLLDRLADAPLLLFVTTRPELLEASPSLFSGRNMAKIEPRGLISSDVATLAQWVAGRPLPEALTRALAERTAGHPLFVEQIVLELRDQGLLDDPDVELPMTPTVEAAVQSRLDHLPPAEKEACKRASVFGRPFTTEELEAMGVAGAAGVLVSLGRRDLVAGRAKAGGGRGRQFQFRSTLVADVAYGMIVDEGRTELHRRAARYLGGQAKADDEEVGKHHERGGELAEAAARYAEAALAASHRGDMETVLRCSGRALELGAPGELRFALHMARADALRGPGRSDEQARELSVAREFVSNDAELARVLTEQAVWMSRRGQSASALTTAEAAVAAAERAGDADVITAARARRVGALIYTGALQQAREAFNAATRSADAAIPQTRALLAAVRAQLAAALGDLGERREAFGAAVALYREAGDIRRAAGAETNLADVYNRVGAYAEAEMALRKAVEGCRRVNNRTMEGYALVNLGYALAMQGKTREALEPLHEALTIATVTREARLALWARIYTTRTRLTYVAPAECALEAEQAAVDAERSGDPGMSVAALTVSARARLAAGDHEGALSSSSRAMSMRDDLGGVEEDEAELFVTHMQALIEADRGAESAQVREQGRARVQQIAERISDPQWRDRFLNDVAANRELMKSRG